MYRKGERTNMLREKRKHANYKPNRRLDAKSSRGMIYENEELRLRTININAEVERGQSEIKSLKREREQLRREIWTLRDEYDKLEHLLRIKGIDPDEFLNQKGNHGEEGDEGDGNYSECSDCSCESCCGENCVDGNASSDNQTTERSDDASSSVENGHKIEVQQMSAAAVAQQKMMSGDEQLKKSLKERNNMNFDHLSTVSEENSEVNSSIRENEESIPINDLSAFLHKVDTFSSLNYLQTLSPPLAHFENLNYDEIGSRVDNQGNIHAGSDPKTSNNLRVKQSSETQSSEKDNKANETQAALPVNDKSQPAAAASAVPEPKKPTRLKFKHFFSPIKKKAATPQLASPTTTAAAPQADVYVNNAIANNLSVNKAAKSDLLPQMVPVPPPLPPPQRMQSNQAQMETSAPPVTSFQTGGNLEELLLDLEAISRDIMSMQVTAPTSLPTTSTSETPEVSKKPFRSELNLFLSYPPPAELNESGSSPENTDNNMPSLPEPMELITPITSTQNNPLFIQHLPSPFPSPIPGTPLTPPMNFKTNPSDPPNFDDYNRLNFPALNQPFVASNSVFCTVSAPSTPASDRKCIEKFLLTEEGQKLSEKKNSEKKSKRVSILKGDVSENTNEPSEPSTPRVDAKDADGRRVTDSSNGSHHSHMHKNHSHIHKRRASLDNAMNATRHKNHRQVANNDPNNNQADRGHRRESSRSYNFKKRSRSEIAFDEGGTSMSERYSNSIASSRESSTSLSVKSGKRRISITSYSESKKIPWCGCWGNSCI